MLGIPIRGRLNAEIQHLYCFWISSITTVDNHVISNFKIFSAVVDDGDALLHDDTLGDALLPDALHGDVVHDDDGDADGAHELEGW